MTKKKKFTTLLVVDASGSMGDKIAEVIGGLKQIFADIKADAVANPDVEMQTIIVDFSYAKDIRIIINTSDSSLLTDKLAESYATRGNTALYDAIAYGFGLVPEGQDGVFVTIMTDGLENDSKVQTSITLKELVEAKKQLGWGITFMGTTETAVHDAVKFGVSFGNTMTFMDSADGVESAMNMSSNTRAAYYSGTVMNTSGVTMDSFQINNLIANAQGSSVVVDETTVPGLTVTPSADSFTSPIEVTFDSPVDTSATE